MPANDDEARATDAATLARGASAGRPHAAPLRQCTSRRRVPRARTGHVRSSAAANKHRCCRPCVQSFEACSRLCTAPAAPMQAARRESSAARRAAPRQSHAPSGCIPFARDGHKARHVTLPAQSGIPHFLIKGGAACSLPNFARRSCARLALVYWCETLQACSSEHDRPSARVAARRAPLRFAPGTWQKQRPKRHLRAAEDGSGR